jgi:hypothetical protein
MMTERRRFAACPVCHDWSYQHKDNGCTAIYEDEEDPNVPIQCSCKLTDAEIIAMDDARLETLKLIQTPTLKKIDLFLGDESNHPDIKTDGRQYLAKIMGRYWCGCFSKQWYGLYFMCGSMGFQFDTPGTNSSSWEALWEIVNEQE